MLAFTWANYYRSFLSIAYCLTLGGALSERNLQLKYNKSHFRSFTGAVQPPVFAFPVTLWTHHNLPSNFRVTHLFAATQNRDYQTKRSKTAQELGN